MSMRKSPAVKLAISVLFMFIFALPIFSQTQREKDEALMRAVRSRNSDPALVERLLAEGANPNYRDNNGPIANHAAERGNDNTDVLLLLAEAGCRFDVINNYENSPLYYAVGRENKFRFILEWEQKNSPNFSGGYSTRKDYIASLFSLDSFSNFSKMVDILVEKGEDMNGFDRYRRNPVWYMADLSDPSALTILRRFIAMGMRLDYVDHEGVSPLRRSLSSERNNDVFLAILRWENENSPSFSGNRASRAEYLSSFLFSLCKESGNETRITALLECGADPNFADAQGRTVLMNDPFLPYISILLRYGANPAATDNNGRTALHLATLDIREARRLIEAGADVNAVDSRGMTPLLFDSREGRNNNVNWFLSLGADPTIADNNGRTVLHYLEFDIETARLLVQAGADVNAEDRYGMTPLMVELASRTGRINRIVNGFVSLGADPLKKTRDGKNLLLIYMENHSLEKYKNNGASSGEVKLLMSLGINPVEADTSGNSALAMSLRYAKDISDDAIAIQEMFLAVATEQEIAAARSNARRKLLPDFKQTNSQRLTQSFFALMPLAYLGFSIWAREGIYRDNPQANWLGSFNTFMTGFITGAVIPGLPLLLIGIADGLDGLWAVALGLFVVPITAIVTGIVWASKSDYRSAFKEHGGLYYIFPVVATGAITIPLLTIIWN